MSTIVGGRVGFVSRAPMSLFFDSFSGGSDGTAISARTPEVGTWVATAPHVLTGAGAARFNSGTRSRTSDLGTPSFVVVCSVTFGTGLDGGIWGRVSDDDNGWILEGFNTNVLLYERNAAVNTQRASFAVGWLAGETHTLGLSFSGNSITALLDGAAQTPFVSAFNSTAQRAGIGGTGAGQALTRWDRFICYGV